MAAMPPGLVRLAALPSSFQQQRARRCRPAAARPPFQPARASQHLDGDQRQHDPHDDGRAAAPEDRLLLLLRRQRAAASAITTALSPDSTMLARMIDPRAAQKAPEVRSMQARCRNRAPQGSPPRSEPAASSGSRSTNACGAHYARTRGLAAQSAALEQPAHLRRVARHLEAALFHDGELGVGGVGAAEISAPAWPMRLPGGAVTPAMKPTIGLLHVGLAPARGVGLVRGRRSRRS